MAEENSSNDEIAVEIGADLEEAEVNIWAVVMEFILAGSLKAIGQSV